MPDSSLCFKTATELATLLRTRKVSAVEVLEAHLAQIERVNPQVNAIVTLVPEQARQQAEAADAAAARGAELGPLHGLPVAHKDLVETKGIRTTFGSPIFADNVPQQDALLVQRMKEAGAITIGKTNTPEFGAGSQTFNAVFGATKNPHDLTKPCGGSSGGAAVSLACRMLPIADGSDLGGSLRNPASFCNVVGFRTSTGRVPSWPGPGWNTFAVDGPMGRTVEDVGLLLSVMAQPDQRDPLSLTDSGVQFRQPLGRDFKGVRVGWSSDLGGLPVDKRVLQTLEKGRVVLEAIGCEVSEDFPDFSGADDIFKTWRAWLFEMKHGEAIKSKREQMKSTVIWNIEAGQQLTGPELGRMELRRTALYHRVREFMETHEFLCLPVAQVPPFPVEQEYITEINGTPMETYLDWMRSCYFITVTGLPAISVPCGFTEDGLPVGLQIVGRSRDELGVLQLAHAFQQANPAWQQVPEVAQPN